MQPGALQPSETSSGEEDADNHNENTYALRARLQSIARAVEDYEAVDDKRLRLDSCSCRMLVLGAPQRQLTCENRG